MPVSYQYSSPGAHAAEMTSVKGYLEKYMRDPSKEPLTNHQQEITNFTEVADDSTRNSPQLTTFDGNENPYHTAVRHQDIQAIKLLNVLYPDTQREKLLLMRKSIALTDKRRGCNLTFLTSQCVAPIHIAVKLWREVDA